MRTIMQANSDMRQSRFGSLNTQDAQGGKKAAQMQGEPEYNPPSYDYATGGV